MSRRGAPRLPLPAGILERLGTVSDGALATEAGCSTGTIMRRRRELGIPVHHGCAECGLDGHSRTSCMLTAPETQVQIAAAALMSGRSRTELRTGAHNLYRAWRDRCAARAAILRAWTADIVARMPPAEVRGDG